MKPSEEFERGVVSGGKLALLSLRTAVEEAGVDWSLVDLLTLIDECERKIAPILPVVCQ